MPASQRTLTTSNQIPNTSTGLLAIFMCIRNPNVLTPYAGAKHSPKDEMHTFHAKGMSTDNRKTV